jgi:hypothetical protein
VEGARPGRAEEKGAGRGGAGGGRAEEEGAGVGGGAPPGPARREDEGLEDVR